ncbi:hypothetical protein CXB51_031152 [Gossypium anomalum]|uniref:Reverse transcriptase zinc-binding domain-containing protein n=1 Tax=Gossypium anomalum TaxID=47600 RepID=A0A8J5Y7Y3_9ROSI|nr:hypothetical protein CXB51_031152 [Gossypium anomalum]
MKIGFSLVSKSDALWVRVLRSKYGWKDQFPDSISRNQSSHLWKSLSMIWPLFRENLIWSFRDGSIVRCWKDPWIPGLGPLVSKFPFLSNLDLNCCVREFVKADGSWNLDLFRGWLPNEVICRVTIIPPPYPNSGSDRVIWARLTSGAFSVCSAYWSLKEDSWNPRSEEWKPIWKYAGPQRVRVFLWLASQQRILTNSERVRRGIGYSTSCTLCGHAVEDLVHVLRDCLIAKDVWNIVLPVQLKQRFFSASFSDWLLLNLCFHESLYGNGFTWPCLFGLLTWRLWKNRNLFIFQNTSWTATEIVKIFSCWACLYLLQIGGCKKVNHNSNPTFSPDDTLVFLSTDGAVARDSRHTAFGGVVRDQDGNWIVGFTRFLRLCTPFEAKVWGILDGILILLNKGYRRATILTDNFEVAQVLKNLNLEDFGITVLRKIQRIMKAEGTWRIKHISRSKNLVVNYLAKLSLSWKSSLQILNKAPKKIIDFLQKDKDNGCLM